MHEPLQVDNLQGPRWDLAMSLLRRGNLVRVRGLLIYLRRDGPPGTQVPDDDAPLVVEIQPPPGWENRTREITDQAKEEIWRLVADSPALSSLVSSRNVKVELIDDYGTGAVRLLTLADEPLS